MNRPQHPNDVVVGWLDHRVGRDLVDVDAGGDDPAADRALRKTEGRFDCQVFEVSFYNCL